MKIFIDEITDVVKIVFEELGYDKLKKLHLIVIRVGSINYIANDKDVPCEVES